jgi:S-adenosylmethionine:tRNA ribosyltransferase-isomerase
MATPTDLFSYDLPPERVAQEPVEPRDHSRLMVLDRKTGAWEHRKFFEIINELKAGDVLVMNNTKVFKARLYGELMDGVTEKRRNIEVFLLRPREGAMPESSVWEALAKPGKLLHPGNRIDLGGFIATVADKQDDGTFLLSFETSVENVLAFADKHGEVPTPPYVKKVPEKLETYQTVYAEKVGSVAAPTAGFHFTPRLLDEIKKKGIQIEFVTLHVGLGTFRPMKTATIEEHEMHAEFVEISADVAQRINQAKQEGRRVIAVGTTTVRTLEGAAAVCHPEGAKRPKDLTRSFADAQDDKYLPRDGLLGDVNLFITPGFEFKIVDALITNFHLPKSTLLVLVSAFAGREHILAAYEEAIRQNYRFYSFGDAMFIH